MLVKIESEPQQDRDKATYEIASDTLSPTMTVSSTDIDDPEGEYDTPPSHSSEPAMIASPTDTGRYSHRGSFAVFCDDCNRVGSF